MSSAHTLPAKVPAPVPVSNGPNAVQKFVQDKDWKFFAAVASVSLIAGAGIYYLTRPSSNETDEPKSSKSKSKKKKNKKKSAANKETSTPEEKGNSSIINHLNRDISSPDPWESNLVDLVLTATESSSDKTKDPSGESDENVETMSAKAIAGLSEKKRNEHAHTLKTRGNSMYSAKKWEEAIRLYSQAIAFHPDPVYYSNRAACYSVIGKFDKVIEDTTLALKMNPTYAKALGRRAQAYESSGKYQDAMHDYTALCILDGFKNESFAQSMERNLKMVADAKAKEILRTREERLPSKTFTSAYLDSFRKTNVPEIKPEEEETGDAQFQLAEYYLGQREYQKAMEAYDKAIELNTTHLAKALNMRGTFTFLMGDGKKALLDFNKAIEADPNYIQTYIKRGSIFMEQGDAEKTFNEFETAISIDPEDPNIYYHRGQVFFITGEHEAAAKDYIKSIELEPKFVFSHIQYGVAQYKLGNITEAMNIFKKALKDFPESGDVNNYYGELLLDQQQFDQAYERFDKAIKLRPSNPLPYINKALLIFQWRQDPAGAERLCLQALDADPECDVAIATLGQLFLQQGKIEKAIEYFDKSVEMSRTETELTSALGFREAASSQLIFARDYPEHARALKGEGQVILQNNVAQLSSELDLTLMELDKAHDTFARLPHYVAKLTAMRNTIAAVSALSKKLKRRGDQVAIGRQKQAIKMQVNRAREQAYDQAIAAVQVNPTPSPPPSARHPSPSVGSIGTTNQSQEYSKATSEVEGKSSNSPSSSSSSIRLPFPLPAKPAFPVISTMKSSSSKGLPPLSTSPNIESFNTDKISEKSISLGGQELDDGTPSIERVERFPQISSLQDDGSVSPQSLSEVEVVRIKRKKKPVSRSSTSSIASISTTTSKRNQGPKSKTKNVLDGSND
ncbi:TOM (translocase of outer membrane) complex component [Entomortierella beljakovae]|nr:TOM (translocase of outer membrane) complex component [Entomortierella beljakovae]